MRKFFVAVGLVVLLGAGLVLFAATFDVNQYSPTIQAKLEKRLGRSVTLGEMHLGFFPPRFRVQNPAIGDDPRFSPDAPFVRAQQMDVALKLLPLLHKQIEISSLNLERPSVNLIKNAAGIWNFASLGRPSVSDKPSPPRPEQRFSLSELTIRDGQISLLDQQKSKVPSLYDHIDFTVNNFSPDKPFTVNAAAHAAGRDLQQVRLEGEGGPLVRENPAATSFHGTLTLKDVGISDLSKFLNSPVLKGTDGTVSGEIKINNEFGRLTARGETQVQNAKLRGMELGYPIFAQYDLTDDQPQGMLTIRNLTLKLGQTPLTASGTVNSKSSPVLLDLNVRTNNISIAEAAKLAVASGMALSQSTTATGNANVDLQLRGSADSPALNGTISGNNIRLSGRDIAQPIQIQSIKLSLTPTQVQSNRFSVASGGTTLTAEFALRDYLSPRPVVDATVRAPNAQLPAILSMAKAYGVSSLDKVNGAGTMNLDLRAAGPLRSINRTEIIRTLNGTIDLDFNNVKYSGANVSQQLASIAGFLNANPAAQTAGVTNISKMTGKILIKNGMAETDNLQAKLDIGNAGAVGIGNLVDSTLNVRVTAVLSSSISQKVGGSSIGGFMQTALANKQGELVIPVLVTGTFSNPAFAPDIQQVARMKVKGLVPNFNDPASITGTLQALLGGSRNFGLDSQSPEKQQVQQPNPVQQLIELFGKKKKPNQQPPN